MYKPLFLIQKYQHISELILLLITPKSYFATIEPKVNNNNDKSQFKIIN